MEERDREEREREKENEKKEELIILRKDVTITLEKSNANRMQSLEHFIFLFIQFKWAQLSTVKDKRNLSRIINE